MSRNVGFTMCTVAYQASRGVFPAARLHFRALREPAAKWSGSSLTGSPNQVSLGQKTAADSCLSVTSHGSPQWHSPAVWHQPCAGFRRGGGVILPPSSQSFAPYVRYRTASAAGSKASGKSSKKNKVTEEALGGNDAEIEEGDADEEEELVELTEEELALREGIESELKEILGDREGEGGSIPWRFAEEDELEGEEEEEDNTQPGDGLDGGGIVLGGAPWGPQLLAMAEGVLDDPQFSEEGLALFGFRIYPERRLVRIRIEKLTDKFGSPSIDELDAFLKELYTEVLAAEARKDLPEDIQIEVSTPGAERVLEVPKDLLRFSSFPMYVCYNENSTEGNSTVEKHEVFELVEVDTDGGAVVWRLADVRINRELMGKGRKLNKKQREGRVRTAFQDINVVRLYLDV